VFYNLAANARRLTGADGSRSGARPEPRGLLVLLFVDDGPGVAPELRQRLFDPYVTAAPRPRPRARPGQAPGRGAGGSVRLLETDSGTSFELALPAVNRHDPSPARVLVVDDDPAAATGPPPAGGLGLRPERGGQRRAGAPALERQRFEAVILDVSMPGWRHRVPGADPGATRPAARDHAHRVRLRAPRSRLPEARRLRLPAQAVRGRRAQGGGRSRGGACASDRRGGDAQARLASQASEPDLADRARWPESSGSSTPSRRPT